MGAEQADRRHLYCSYHTTYKSDNKNWCPQSLKQNKDLCPQLNYTHHKHHSVEGHSNLSRSKPQIPSVYFINSLGSLQFLQNIHSCLVWFLWKFILFSPIKTIYVHRNFNATVTSYTFRSKYFTPPPPPPPLPKYNIYHISHRSFSLSFRTNVGGDKLR